MTKWCHSPVNADTEQNELLKSFKDLNQLETLQALKCHNTNPADHDLMHDSCKPGI